MENQTLAHSLKRLIQEHYDGETEPIICERVKYEVIPLLITMFFDASFINRPSSSILKEISLNQHHQQSKQYSKKNITHPSKQLLSVNKLIGIFNVALSLQFIQLRKKGNTFKEIQQYLLMKERILLNCKDVHEKQLKRLVMQKIKHYKTVSTQIDTGIKIVGKIIERRMEDSFQSLKQRRQGKNTMKEISQIGIGLLSLVFRRRMRQTLNKINEYSHNTSIWKQKIIRKMALNSPINFQISFWRLKHFHHYCYPLGKMVKLINIHGKKSAFLVLKRRTNENTEELEQKCEYFLECLQNCQDVKNFSLLMDAFIALERC